MSFLYGIFNQPSSPDWFVAAGTFFLGFVTIVLHFWGDSSTRLMKAKINYDFQKRAYNFLNKIFVSSGTKDKVSDLNSNSSIFIDKYIENFYYDILDNRIFLTKSNTKRLKKYILLATEYAKAWDTGNDNEIKKFVKPVLCEMITLAKTIGNEKETCRLKKQFPDFFAKKSCEDG